IPGRQFPAVTLFHCPRGRVYRLAGRPEIDENRIRRVEHIDTRQIGKQRIGFFRQHRTNIRIPGRNIGSPELVSLISDFRARVRVEIPRGWSANRAYLKPEAKTIGFSPLEITKNGKLAPVTFRGFEVPPSDAEPQSTKAERLIEV